ncbi:(2Fe-2S)-binding protein [Alteromonas halophila]|uniref:(2Fe-2S)-binding protein n=1 Tax=Alteromonas halophila TaxID=516698 RepID=A0A918JP72_9ALTE|nr:(2Fe-2S)-binding protein [Alteromonas halophila]GGW89760.1 (2Fe-2S)-binding protein [Alteromonas halophila]
MKLKINGKTHEFSGDTAMPLLWFLRDELQLTGTKYGCGMALCGACTVHVDGEPMRACQLPISATEGKSVTTIEGLDTQHEHPLQVAWAEHNVPQCGYCQSGQIMQAASLLAKNAAPTDEEIDNHMSGNICRCGTYPRIRNAIKSAAKGE